MRLCIGMLTAWSPIHWHVNNMIANTLFSKKSGPSCHTLKQIRSWELQSAPCFTRASLLACAQRRSGGQTADTGDWLSVDPSPASWISTVRWLYFLAATTGNLCKRLMLTTFVCDKVRRYIRCVIEQSRMFVKSGERKDGKTAIDGTRRTWDHWPYRLNMMLFLCQASL